MYFCVDVTRSNMLLHAQSISELLVAGVIGASDVSVQCHVLAELVVYSAWRPHCLPCADTATRT